MQKEDMITITYKNEKTPHGDEFNAFFETLRGAQLFMNTLEEKGIDYKTSNI